MTGCRLFVAFSVFALPGCPALSGEAPPPPRKAEIPIAPPRARGALAAGTDAAPRPDVTLPDGETLPGTPDSPPAAPAPAPSDSAPPPALPGPTPGHAVAPDGGMAL